MSRDSLSLSCLTLSHSLTFLSVSLATLLAQSLIHYLTVLSPPYDRIRQCACRLSDNLSLSVCADCMYICPVFVPVFERTAQWITSHTRTHTRTRRMSLVHKRLLRTCVHLFSDFDGVVIFQITACCRRCQTRRWWRIL